MWLEWKPVSDDLHTVEVDGVRGHVTRHSDGSVTFSVSTGPYGKMEGMENAWEVAKATVLKHILQALAPAPQQAAKPKRMPKGAHLHQALLAVHREASERPLKRSVHGGQRHDGTDWFHASEKDVYSRTHGLFHQHGLFIKLSGQQIVGAYSETRWTIVHAESMETDTITFQIPLERPDGVALTVELARRMAHMHWAGIRTEEDPNATRPQLEDDDFPRETARRVVGRSARTESGLVSMEERRG